MSTPQIPTIDLKVRQLATQSPYSMIALVLMSVCPLRTLAQDAHSHTLIPQHQALTPDQKSKVSALIKIVRESTERFKDVSMAEAEGYALQFGCVSGPDAGAMGLHFVNRPLVSGGVLDATHPQIVIYEPTSNGGLRQSASTICCSRPRGTQSIRVRRSSWDSFFTCSTLPIGSASRHFTPCMFGRGRKIPTARS
jgi:hypothetical protein